MQLICLLAVHEQYRSHNKASMGREPALEAIPVILDRDQFSPAAVSPDSGWDLPPAAVRQLEKAGKKDTEGCGRVGGGHQHQLEATGRGYKETESIPKYECAHLPPHPLFPAISVTSTTVWPNLLARRKDIRVLHVKEGSIGESHLLWHWLNHKQLSESSYWSWGGCPPGQHSPFPLAFLLPLDTSCTFRCCALGWWAHCANTSTLARHAP